MRKLDIFHGEDPYFIYSLNLVWKVKFESPSLKITLESSLSVHSNALTLTLYDSLYTIWSFYLQLNLNFVFCMYSFRFVSFMHFSVNYRNYSYFMFSNNEVNKHHLFHGNETSTNNLLTTKQSMMDSKSGRQCNRKWNNFENCPIVSDKTLCSKRIYYFWIYKNILMDGEKKSVETIENWNQMNMNWK